MSGFLPDNLLGRLQRNLDVPDLTGTDFVLGQEIGRGGMGVVYSAKDLRLDREVALKVMNAAQPDVELMVQEARILARLDHPGIAPVYMAGVLPDGRVYYAMKLVHGTRLDDYVLHKPGLPECLRLFERICEPVAFAHARGIVHRDLKPQNIMVGEFGEVLVIDWGIARQKSEEPDPLIAGTKDFMAPEQASGGAVGLEADVYSLGKILALLVQPSLTGEPVPRAVRSILKYATAAKPEERYANAEDLSADVNRFLNGYPVLAHKENVWEKSLRVLGRNRTWVALLAAYLIMRILIFFFSRF